MTIPSSERCSLRERLILSIKDAVIDWYCTAIELAEPANLIVVAFFVAALYLVWTWLGVI